MIEYRVLSIPDIDRFDEDEVKTFIQILFNKGMISNNFEFCHRALRANYEDCGSYLEGVLNFLYHICRFELVAVDRGLYYFKHK